MNFSTGKQVAAIDYLIATIPEPWRNVIDRLCALLHPWTKKEVSFSDQGQDVQTSLIHLITIVNVIPQSIPYLLSNRFKWDNAFVDSSNPNTLSMPLALEKTEQREISFFEYLLLGIFVHQPKLVEQLIMDILSKTSMICVPSSSGDKPVTLNVIWTLEIWKLLDRSLKTLASCLKERPCLSLASIASNYVKLVSLLEPFLLSALQKRPQSEKRVIGGIIEGIAQNICLIYEELCLRNPEFNSEAIDFSSAKRMISVLYQLVHGLNEDAVKTFIKSNASFIYSNMLELQSIKISTSNDSLDNLKLINAPIVSNEKAVQASQSSSTQPQEFSRFIIAKREAHGGYYNLLDSGILSVQSPEIAACEQSHKNLCQISGFSLQTDIIGPFCNSFLGFNNVKHNYGLLTAYFEKFKSDAQLNHQQLAETLAQKLKSIVTEELLLNSEKEEEKEKESNTAEREKAVSELKKFAENLKKLVPINTANTNPPTQCSVTGDPILKIEEEKKEQISAQELSLNSARFIPTSLEASPTLDREPDELQYSGVEENEDEAALDAKFLSNKAILEEACALTIKLQKQLLEGLLVLDLKYFLPNIDVSQTEIRRERKRYVIGFAKGLKYYTRKVFIHYLPPALKSFFITPKNDLPGFHPKLRDEIVKLIKERNLIREDQLVKFEFAQPLSRTVSTRENSCIGSKAPSNVVTNATPVAEDSGPLNEAQAVKDCLKFYENESKVELALDMVTWLRLTDSQLEKFVLNAVTKRADPAIYSQILLNPLNHVKFMASLLELFEDSSLTKLQALLHAFAVTDKVSYLQVCKNILAILRSNISQFDISLRLPTGFIKKFVLPRLATKHSKEEVFLQNGLHRVLTISLQIDDTLAADTFESLATNLGQATRVHVLKDPSPLFHNQLQHHVFSLEFVEVIWEAILKWAKRSSLSPQQEKVLKLLVQDHVFCEAFKNPILNFILSLVGPANETLVECIAEFKAASMKAARSNALNKISESNEVQSLFVLIGLICDSTLSNFNGITGRKSFNDKNEISKGKLFKSVTLLDALVKGLSVTKVRDFVVHGFEIIDYTSSIEKTNPRKIRNVLPLFKFLVDLKAAVILVQEIAIPFREAIQPTDFESLSLAAHDPDLSRYVSRDIVELTELSTLKKSYSQLKNSDEKIRFDEVYAHCILSMKPTIIELFKTIPKCTAHTIFHLKFNLMEDLSAKEAAAGIRLNLSQNRKILTHILIP
mgnify:FL=1